MGIAIGIDLGTTNSCVAVVQAQRARVVENAAGKRIHPSVISFHPDGSVLASWEAKDRLIIDSQNTIFSFKRLIGRDFASEEMQQAIKDLPYEVIEGPGGTPAVSARGREITVPEISAMMLKHLKEMCHQTLGVEIDEAVVTVPANFNDVQRSSTKVAGRIAGLDVLRILNEPTAAALAYGFGGKLSERIAIYDFGGGTFDVTIIELMDDIFEVLSTAGESYLGGDDLDELIFQEMRDQFLKQSKYDVSEDLQAAQRVRSVAERVKCQLSTIDEVQATLREIAFGPGGKALDFTFTMTRQRFESLIEPLVDQSLRVCDEALKLAKLDRYSLDNLVLVGGTTRVPLVRKKVEEYFGRKPRMEINPDEVVAIGAAIHAFSLTGEELPADLPEPPPMQDRAGLTEAVRTSNIPPPPSRPAVMLSEPTEPPPVDASGPPVIALDPSEPAPSGPLAPPVEEPIELDAELLEELPPSEPPPAPPSAEEVDELGALFDKAADDIGLPPPAPPEPATPPEPPAAQVDAIPPVLLGPDESETSSLPDSSSAPLEPPPVAVREEPSVPPVLEPPPMVKAPPRKGPPPMVEAPPPLDEVAGEAEARAEVGTADSFTVAVGKTAPSTLLLDVTPRGLGVGTTGGYCDEIIARNASIPVEQSRMFNTSRDNQTEVVIDVFQGESRRVEENTRLGRVELSGIRPAPRGEIKIRVTFEIDTDGILGVSARNEETGEAQSTRIVLSGGLTDEDVNDLIEKYAK
jgi:molecular chaperone DnaK